MTAYELPNASGTGNFATGDAIVPDPHNHKKGDWDFVARGGNGYRSRSIGSTSPGSNGSIFGDGYTSTGREPSSCGAPGTDNSRGQPAKGSDAIGWDLLSYGSKKYIIEELPTGVSEGGTGKFSFSRTVADTTFSDGLPVAHPSPEVLTVPEGARPMRAGAGVGSYCTIVVVVEYF